MRIVAELSSSDRTAQRGRASRRESDDAAAAAVGQGRTVPVRLFADDAAGTSANGSISLDFAVPPPVPVALTKPRVPPTGQTSMTQGLCTTDESGGGGAEGRGGL